MDQRQEEVTRRPLYVYDLPSDIITTLVPKFEASYDANDPTEAIPEEEHSVDDRKEPIIDGSKACSLCRITFQTLEDQRGHIRSDWHGYNLKKKLKGLQAVSAEQFERLIEDLEESLSGSDSSDSEEEGDGHGSRKDTILSALLKRQAAVSESGADELNAISSTKRKRGSGRPPLLWFSTPTLPPNIYLGIYRAIFTKHEQEDEKNILDTIRKKQLPAESAPKLHADIDNGGYKSPHVFLCMIGGGHFAAMIVSLAPQNKKSSATGPLAREATVLANKTFHRYTTRRKQGGAQSANDSAKGAAHSAGSSLRRYNEAALTDEVRLLLSDWKGMIDTSELLFVRATGNTNRKTLFGPYDGQVLHQNDPRLRGFPFSTRRATQHELMRSFIELTRVKVREINEAAIAAALAATKEARKQALFSKIPKEKSHVSLQRSEEEETAILHTSQLQSLIRRSKLPALLSYLNTNDLDADFRFYPQDSQQNYHASTPLHLAASVNSPTLVSGLLLKASANPLLLNGDGKPPYDLAGDRTTRDAFRVARSLLGEHRWQWDVGHIPSAIDKAEADERDAKERQEVIQREAERRRAEIDRLNQDDPKVVYSASLGKAAGKGRASALGHVQKTAQEKREEEVRGLTPEMRVRLERERRARAAEERIKQLQNGP